MSVFIEEVDFLEPGRALYVFSNAGSRECINGTPPKDQLGVDCVMRDAHDRYESLYAILMSHQDFKAYSNSLR